jgi:predicted RNA-binding Zn-ribbon protein involved in translation (DUF1610 family)
MNRKFAKYKCDKCGVKKISKKAECKECAKPVPAPAPKKKATKKAE